MDLAQRMMHLTPQERPKASQCLQHHWFIEDHPRAYKRHRSSSFGGLPSKRVPRKIFPITATDNGPTRMLVKCMFQGERSLETELNTLGREPELKRIAQVVPSAGVSELEDKSKDFEKLED
ncbi:hypothetical protein MMC13_003252 [Lambiella insularis]|nr:hypothetical protein [Lambiella insularis]